MKFQPDCSVAYGGISLALILIADVLAVQNRGTID
jgi:hypothetical protein